MPLPLTPSRCLVAKQPLRRSAVPSSVEQASALPSLFYIVGLGLTILQPSTS